MKKSFTKNQWIAITGIIVALIIGVATIYFANQSSINISDSSLNLSPILYNSPSSTINYNIDARPKLFSWAIQSGDVPVKSGFKQTFVLVITPSTKISEIDLHSPTEGFLNDSLHLDDIRLVMLAGVPGIPDGYYQSATVSFLTKEKIRNLNDFVFSVK